jgi:hypothetical protein
MVLFLRGILLSFGGNLLILVLGCYYPRSFLLLRGAEEEVKEY